MAKHKYEFRPDKTGHGLLHKLYLTKKQRLSLLKWTLFGLLLLALSVLQDVILCRLRNIGITTDLVPCAIFLIFVYLGTEPGCVFGLIAAAAYQFSGTAPGYYIIAVITLLGLITTMFRQGYLRKSMSADILCAGVSFALYELIIYGVALLSGISSLQRLGSTAVTLLLSGITMPALYPLIQSIDRIGGETWKE